MTSYLIDTIKDVCTNSKRIKNELLCYAFYQKNLEYRKFPVHKDACLCTVEKNNLRMKSTFILYVTEKKSTVVNIIFNNKKPYPWYPPDVYLFDYDYHQLLMTDLSMFKFDTVRCLCCESLLCKDIWNIQKKLFDLFEEIKKNLKLKMRKSDLLCCKHVVNQIFGTYIPVDKFL